MSSIRIIAGKYRGKILDTLAGNDTRPTTGRIVENLFNILLHIPNYNIDLANSYFLDLFAGSGRLSIEVISRGAKGGILIDNSIDAIKVITKNISSIDKLNQVHILQKDACNLTPNKSYPKANIIFCDAPYHHNISSDAVISAYKNNWIADNAIIIIETGKDNNDINFDFADLLQKRNYGITNLYFFKVIK